MKFLLNASGFFTAWRLPCAFWPWVAQVGSPSSYRYLPPYSFLPLQRQSVKASNIFNFSACWRFPSPIVKSKHQIEILGKCSSKERVGGWKAQYVAEELGKACLGCPSVSLVSGIQPFLESVPSSKCLVRLIGFIRLASPHLKEAEANNSWSLRKTRNSTKVSTCLNNVQSTHMAVLMLFWDLYCAAVAYIYTHRWSKMHA